MSLFQEGYKLYYRQIVAQLHVNENKYISHNCFHYFVHPLIHAYTNTGIMPKDVASHYAFILRD